MNISIKLKISLLCLLSLIGFASILIVATNALSKNTEDVINIRQVAYPVMNSAEMNKVLLQQIDERFNLAVTLGDDELLEVNQETLKNMLANLQLQANLMPDLKKEINNLSVQLNNYYQSNNTIAFGMIEGTLTLKEVAKLAPKNRKMLSELTTNIEKFSSVRIEVFKKSISALEASNISST